MKESIDGERVAAINKTLELLRNAEGNISGEQMASDLDVSRTAVWKQIEQLRHRGYAIEGSSRVGYRLSGIPKEPVSDEVCFHLGEAYPAEVHYYESIDSTNDKAKELAAHGAPDATIVIANTQRSGRGRRERAWQSPRGGLWMSVILRPVLPLGRVTRMAIASAVVVAEAIEKETALAPCIKWPNDVLLDGKKLAGILIEVVAEMERISYVVVGVGLNANVEESAMEPEIRPYAVSLLTALGYEVKTASLAARVAGGLLEMSGTLDDEHMPRWLASWRRRSAVLGRPVTIAGGSETLEGEAVDIDMEGALLVRTATGDMVTARLGESSLRLASNHG